MGFYDLNKEARQQLAGKIKREIQQNIQAGTTNSLMLYFSDEDTYIRKNAYLSIGKIALEQPELLPSILRILKDLWNSHNEKIRQTVINAAGEIGKFNFEPIAEFMTAGLFDKHHSVRNAVIGSIKKMGEKNPVPTLLYAKQYLTHPDKEIRREICHGIELRGRTHPQDILPFLKALQHDKTARVKNTLVHVIGQIAYKKGCLETVIADLKTWENRELVLQAIEEIIDVHHRYRNFAVKTQAEAIAYIEENF